MVDMCDLANKIVDIEWCDDVRNDWHRYRVLAFDPVTEWIYLQGEHYYDIKINQMIHFNGHPIWVPLDAINMIEVLPLH